MPLRCKPGDLAVVVRAPVSVPEQKDRIVEVVRRYQEGETLCGFVCETQGRPVWVCRASSLLPVRDLNSGAFEWVPELAIADDRLRPISGVPVDEEVVEEVTA